VWSILWDLNDNVPDGSDNLAIGFAPIWQVLTGAQRTTPALTTIFSFIAALKVIRPADSGNIDALVAAQNIDAAGIDAFGTGESHAPTNVPSAAALPLFTTITVGGGPMVVRTVNDVGQFNKLGNRRFLRFTPTESRTVNISLATSNPNSPDPDFTLRRAGTVLLVEDDPAELPETGSIAVVRGATYVLDVYDCSNGCDTATANGSGDYDLTVTIN
jgi:hypothetical protein